MGNTNTKEAVSEFIRNNLRGKPDPDAIPRMCRMLLVDKSITNIDVKDSDYTDWTALHYQAGWGTTGIVAWLLTQDPPAYIDVLGPGQWTPLIAAAYSGIDSEGKVRLLIEYGANRDLEDVDGRTALRYARSINKPAAVIDLLVNYRPDVSR